MSMIWEPPAPKRGPDGAVLLLAVVAVIAGVFQGVA